MAYKILFFFYHIEFLFNIISQYSIALLINEEKEKNRTNPLKYIIFHLIMGQPRMCHYK